MYAIVEFEKKECALVPLRWLVENNSKCCWPPIKTNNALIQHVKENVVPNSSWATYKVLKLIAFCDSYDAGNERLQQVIEESTTDATHTDASCAVQAEKPLVLKSLQHFWDSDQENVSDDDTPSIININELSKSAKLKKAYNDDDSAESFSDNFTPTPSKKSKLSRNDVFKHSEISHNNQSIDKNRQLNSAKPRCNIDDEDSSDSSSDDSFTIANRKLKKLTTDTSTKKQVSISHENAHASPLQAIAHQSHNHSSESIVQSVSTTSNYPSTLTTEGYEKILRHLSRIDETQQRQSTVLENILAILQSQNISSLVKPTTNVPNLPISCKKEYRELEGFLKEEENFDYMKRRLAIIGGSSVRDTTMNIMKHILTNEVAMQFNWAGRDKRAFKKTRMMVVVCEAVKLAYIGRPSDDLTDINIASAIKSWLKLAKSRFMYRNSKKTS